MSSSLVKGNLSSYSFFFTAIIRVWLIFLTSRNPIVNKLLHSFVILSPSLRSRVNSAKDLPLRRKGLSRYIGIRSTAFSVSLLVRLGTPTWGTSYGGVPRTDTCACVTGRCRQVQARKHGGAGGYKWCKIAMSFPPRTVVRGGNPVNLVSTLLRLRPQLLIKL